MQNQSIAKPGPVLGIETSCDETGVAVFSVAQGLLAHALYSQIDMHAEYGGVVPELASRDHVRKLLPLIRATLAQAGMSTRDLGGVAYTAGPGLVGALLVGASCARALAWALDVPAIGVHHMEGHLLAPMLEAPDLVLRAGELTDHAIVRRKLLVVDLRMHRLEPVRRTRRRSATDEEGLRLWAFLLHHGILTYGNRCSQYVARSHCFVLHFPTADEAMASSYA